MGKGKFSDITGNFAASEFNRTLASGEVLGHGVLVCLCARYYLYYGVHTIAALACVCFDRFDQRKAKRHEY